MASQRWCSRLAWCWAARASGMRMPQHLFSCQRGCHNISDLLTTPMLLLNIKERLVQAFLTDLNYKSWFWDIEYCFNVNALWLLLNSENIFKENVLLQDCVWIQKFYLQNWGLMWCVYVCVHTWYPRLQLHHKGCKKKTVPLKQRWQEMIFIVVCCYKWANKIFEINIWCPIIYSWQLAA